MERWRETDLAWVAGFFEGEGCVGIRRLVNRKNTSRSYRTTTLKCLVGQVDIEPLQKLLMMFGGNIKVGCKGTDRWQKSFCWEIHARKASAFLKAIRPFIVRPRVLEKIALALEFQEQKHPPGRSPLRFEYDRKQLEYYFKMKELNRKGPRNAKT